MPGEAPARGHAGLQLKAEIAQILKDNSYIQDFRTLETEDGRKVLRVILKYAGGGQSVIRDLQRVSSPGLRRYVGVDRDPARAQRTRHGDPQHVAGVMSDRQARQSRTGGELLALVW